MNKPILKKGDNPSIVLHEFVKRNFKEEMKVEIIYISNFYFSSEIRVRITLPDGTFWEDDGRNKKAAKRKAAKYIIDNWGKLQSAEWTPKEGFWSVNGHLYLQSNRMYAGSYEKLIKNNNCFINKPIAYWVIETIKNLLFEYKNKDNNWSPEIGEKYYCIGDLVEPRVRETKACKYDFNGYGVFTANNKFKTQEEAESFLSKIKEIFKQGRDLSTESWKDGGTCYEIDCYQKLAQERANTRRIINSQYHN